MENLEKARAFWTWFVKEEQAIMRALDSNEDNWFRSEMTPRVLGLLPDHHSGLRINWEIGPGHQKQWYFALSPLVKTNLPITRLAVSVAPDLAQWEILPAKPPREMSKPEYRLKGVEGDHLFSFSNWEYVLLQHDAKQFSIDLIGDFPIQADDMIKKKAAYLIVEGLLGEEFLLEHIASINPVNTEEADPQLPRSKLRVLKRQINQLLAKNNT